jgi:hypothetical protein
MWAATFPACQADPAGGPGCDAGGGRYRSAGVQDQVQHIGDGQDQAADAGGYRQLGSRHSVWPRDTEPDTRRLVVRKSPGGRPLPDCAWSVVMPLLLDLGGHSRFGRGEPDSDQTDGLLNRGVRPARFDRHVGRACEAANPGRATGRSARRSRSERGRTAASTGDRRKRGGIPTTDQDGAALDRTKSCGKGGPPRWTAPARGSRPSY